MSEHLPDRLLPPSYVNVPVSLVYAAGHERVILTLIRIVGLCWQRRGRCTPALTMDQLARVLHRPRRTLRRHLAELEALGWLQVDRVGPVGHDGERFVLRPSPGGLPLPGEPAPSPAGEGGPDGAGRGHTTREVNHAVQRALAEAGVENPARDALARDPRLEPDWVRGWHLWTRHPDRAGLENPAGYLVVQLRAGYPPPEAYAQLAALDEEQRAQLRASYWTGGRDLDEDLYALRPLYLALRPALEGDPV